VIACGVLAANATQAGLLARDLGVVVNAADPLSVRVADYYRERRGIPARNVVRTRFAAGAVLSAREFARVKSEVDAQMPAHVQVLALAWTKPYRVDCMSITSAFAFGFDAGYCAEGCRPTPYSPYFNSDSRRPFDDFGLRPAMSLAGGDFAHVRELIDRAVASDGAAPRGSAYLLETSDPARNVRTRSFGLAKLLERQGLAVRILKADRIEGRADVMFYFTGLPDVDAIPTNRFLPGSVADHLTSTAGVLVGGRQMSALRWLEAGAAGSYGTVVEPCAFASKFPSVPILMRRYLAGETLIEAYWKSLAMPSQGLFVGEPLAAPFRSDRQARGFHGADTSRSRSRRN
jgi:uncharacterized protein (TIGR03790 family)